MHIEPLSELLHDTNIAKIKSGKKKKKKHLIVLSHATDFMQCSNKHWSWSKAEDRFGRSTES